MVRRSLMTVVVHAATEHSGVLLGEYTRGIGYMHRPKCGTKGATFCTDDPSKVTCRKCAAR
jgi:hypothetical protein